MEDEIKPFKPELCNSVAYSITPNHQPIIIDDTYYCKYCGFEVEATIVLGIKVGWMHKENGKYHRLQS